MPFATRCSTDPVPPMDSLPGLAIRREYDAMMMATLQARTPEEITRRFDGGHRAYVAWRNGEPAAWGWVATRSADIGETGTSFHIPMAERYLWNFATVPAHRGHGIYPRLLDAIVRAESRGESPAERFWVAYAPENHASGAGIQKAGFVALAELSFDAHGHAALKNLLPGGAKIVGRLLGLPEAKDDLAQCWRCVRAGRGSMSCAPGRCRCDYQIPTSGCAA